MRERLSGFLAQRSQFTVNVAKVSTGTVLRTVIAFGTMPIVTRLYAPEDFGNFQLLLSIVGPLVAISTLKYELAIVLQKERTDSRRAAVLCLAIVALLGCLIGLLCFWFGPWFLGLFDAARLAPYVGLVAVGFVAGGVLRTANYSLIASQQFGTVARANVSQVATTQGSYIGLGLWQPSFLGLFASGLAGQAVAIVVALRRAPIRLRGTTGRALLEMARRNRKFPLVNTPGVFVNTLAHEMPVFLLARYFDAEIVGFYMIAERLLNQPMALIGEAVAKVYLQSAADAASQGGRELRTHFRRTAGRLLMLAAPFAVGVVLLAPWVTGLVLGEGYREVGVIMQILIAGSALRLVSAPLFTTFSVVNRQEIGVGLMAASSVARIAAMIAFSASPHEMLAALMVSSAAFSILYLFAVDRTLARLPADAPTQAGT